MKIYTLADLESYDPHSPLRGPERRFLCPNCGDGKARDNAHRSLIANIKSGAWNCKRCGDTGKLRDFWHEKPQQNRARVRGSLRHLSARDDAQEQGDTGEWRAALKDLQPLKSTEAQKYLQSRGIELEVAQSAGARFSGDFYGRPAVVFPLRDRQDVLVAACGRYVDGRDKPKTRIAGRKREGVFSAPVLLSGGRQLYPFDRDSPAVLITEAPLDALSLAVAGYPAIALCGTSGPAWLRIACGLRRVFLAFDADLAGEKAANDLRAVLEPLGASCGLLRPSNGKDWNETLCTHGVTALAEWLAAEVLLHSTTRTLLENQNDDSTFDD